MVYDLREESILKDYINLRLEYLNKNIDETPEGNKLYHEIVHTYEETIQSLPQECLKSVLKLIELENNKAKLGMRYAYLVGIHDGMNVDIVSGEIA